MSQRLRVGSQALALAMGTMVVLTDRKNLEARNEKRRQEWAAQHSPSANKSST
ncbi:hypothetical protein HK100_000511 [Physocladia obscura]|uniref:Uncharacterized protein n=1 Tax=Physocladia obscura TaxID=109957 RepID=A0AAD5T047_9FUNG|nr:hypothetical protein HK100_000511 [Physocladia obscura]